MNNFEGYSKFLEDILKYGEEYVTMFQKKIDLKDIDLSMIEDDQGKEMFIEAIEENIPLNSLMRSIYGLGCEKVGMGLLSRKRSLYTKLRAEKREFILRSFENGCMDTILSLCHKDSVARENFSLRAKRINMLKRIVTEGAESCPGSSEMVDSIDISLLGLSTHTFHMLMRCRMGTVGAIRERVLSMGVSSLGKLRGCGPASLREIAEKILIPFRLVDHEGD